MNFFDFNVHSHPESKTPPDELWKTAKRYGFAGIAITNHDFPFDGDFAYKGIEICAKNPTELYSKVKKYRKRVEVLLVHGGDEKIDRAALKNPKVDVLAHPGSLNHVLARFASENGVAIEFNIGEIIHKRGRGRWQALSTMRNNLKLVRKFKVSALLSSNAYSIYDLRAPREIISLSTIFGMKKEEAKKALSETPQKIIESQRH
ncbi:MAG: ribonuclease P protein component 3 [Candidatus Syntropharchaeia archaeon]